MAQQQTSVSENTLKISQPEIQTQSSREIQVTKEVGFSIKTSDDSVKIPSQEFVDDAFDALVHEIRYQRGPKRAQACQYTVRLCYNVRKTGDHSDYVVVLIDTDMEEIDGCIQVCGWTIVEEEAEDIDWSAYKKCSNCSGRGWSMEDTPTGTYEEVTCADCDGTGNDV